jgi:Flp pilus assembly pilin Flp
MACVMQVKKTGTPSERVITAQKSFEAFYREEGKPMINKIILSAKIALRRLKSRKGQTLVEYALILAFISVVAIAVLIALGGQIKTVYTSISSQIAIAQSSH